MNLRTWYKDDKSIVHIRQFGYVDLLNVNYQSRKQLDLRHLRLYGVSHFGSSGYCHTRKLPDFDA